jgi:hexosaminidase
MVSGIIPKPVYVENLQGQFILSDASMISVSGNSEELDGLSSYFINEIESVTGIQLQRAGQQAEDGSIQLILNESMESPEGYKLSIRPGQLKIEACETAGLFYGIQTFLQVIASGTQGTDQLSVSCMKIEDRPQFEWRGMHLDVSRHFRDKEFIKKFIDLLALHKLNVFHWHLTDDQGWRVEIKKYPELTIKGAWREDRRGERWNLEDDQREPYTPGKPYYGGFYTQEDIREIVAYAEARYVTIVPEIEMPGHSRAALVAYPEVSCFGYETKVPSGGFVGENWDFSDPYCAGKEETFEFLQDIMDELTELFPSEYIHIGGDECSKRRWKECPHCQRRIEDEGLEDEFELQSYFINRIEKYLNSKERKIIGWQEILEGGMDPSAAIMPWKGATALEVSLEAAKGGHEVIMAASDHLYFGPSLSLETIYAYNPIPDGLAPQYQDFIIGVEACAWAEGLVTDAITENVVVPRIAALAEVGWTEASSRNWENFRSRLEILKVKYRQMEVNYFVPAPENLPQKSVFTESVMVRMDAPQEGLVLRFTSDGSEPSIHSKEFMGPFETSETLHLKVAAFDPNGQKSKTVHSSFEKQALRESVHPEDPAPGLAYRSHDKRFRSVHNIDGDKGSEERGILSAIEVVSKNGELDAGLLLEGYIKIPRDGIYTFYTASDDGSLLWMGSDLVVDNDGFHSGVDRDGNLRTLSGQIALSQGYHPIKIGYFDWGGGELLEVLYEGPGVEYQELAPEILFH